MTTKIQKWGNSLGLRIPKEILDSLNIGEKTEVEITKKAGKIEIKPKSKDTKYNLEDLVKDINPENNHPEIDWGPPVGKEIW